MKFRLDDNFTKLIAISHDVIWAKPVMTLITATNSL
jgi:hypothetical protein